MACNHHLIMHSHVSFSQHEPESEWGAGRVCGVGAALPDLWRTRAPVAVEQGVDLTQCNAALGPALLTLPCLLLLVT